MAAKLTDSARKALTILFDHGATTGGPFASRMWPETWNEGGTDRLHGLRRRGGSYLMYLRGKGLVDLDMHVCEYNMGYRISYEGRKALEVSHG